MAKGVFLSCGHVSLTNLLPPGHEAVGAYFD